MFHKNKQKNYGMPEIEIGKIASYILDRAVWEE